MTPIPEPALETAVADAGGATRTAPAALTPLEHLLARGRVRAMLAMLGPAFVAAVAYVDPGNFATNFQAGSRFGYALLWVVLLANLVAMLIQYLSAKLGIATGKSLPELCRARFPRWTSWALWIQAELIAMATDLAEFLGAAIGLNLLFDVPLLPAGLITGVIAFAILALQRRGYRRFELAIAALLGIVFAGFLYETLRIGPSAHASLDGLIPGLSGTDELYLAVGIVGATVMPHVIYLQSELTKGRVALHDDAERRRVLRFERIDVIVALGLAGAINLAMLAAAAKLFHSPGHQVTTIEGAHAGLGQLVGGGAALAFASRAAGVGCFVVERRHARRPGRDGGLHQSADPGLRPPRGDDGAGAGDPRGRGESDRGAGAQPGRAVVRDPVCAGAAGHADRAA